MAPSTLASIASTESGFEALSVNDDTTKTSGVPASFDVAKQLAAKLIEAGHSVDVGIMQINSGNFKSLGLTLDDALDPCKSIAAAAVILAGNFSASGDTHDAQQAALRVALSKYNTGDARRGFENGYVRKVELSARRVVPALDVGSAPAAIDGAASAAAPPDPNAPPSWDVWASFDYDAARHRDPTASPRDSEGAGQAAVTYAGSGPPASATVSGPTSER